MKKIKIDSYLMEELLYTLDICKINLPVGTHPVHLERLRVIEKIIKERREGNANNE